MVNLTGLMDKQHEGSRKTKPTYQAVAIYEIMAVEKIIGGMFKHKAGEGAGAGRTNQRVTRTAARMMMRRTRESSPQNFRSEITLALALALSSLSPSLSPSAVAGACAHMSGGLNSLRLARNIVFFSVGPTSLVTTCTRI